MIGDNLVNELKDPMRWLYHACEPGGRVPLAHNEDYYKASWDLFELGQAYRWFAFAYTYFRHGRIGLELQESTIQPTEDLFTNIEYNAYNRLLKPHQLQEVLSSVNSNSLHLLEDAIKYSLKIKGDRFSYKLNPRMVSDTIEAFIKPRLDIIFSLPSEWQFGCYTLEDFHKVFGQFQRSHIFMQRRGVWLRTGGVLAWAILTAFTCQLVESCSGVLLDIPERQSQRYEVSLMIYPMEVEAF